MKRIATLSLAAMLLLGGAAAPASAQLTAASEGPVVYGHHHLNVTDAAAHKRFWADTLGGTPTPFGRSEIYKFPNVLVFAREGEPTGGTRGSTVNHLGFRVPSVRAMLSKVRAAGFPIVTRQELPPALSVIDDMAYIENQDTYVAFVMGPDDVKVELLENRGQEEPIALHHIHFDANDVEAMKAWYVDMFGAAPGMRGSFEAADLPGVNLTYSPNPASLAGTEGRSLDHIGFEVDGLEAFCKELEAKGCDVRPAVPGDRATWHRDCVLHGSVRHLHRVDRGAGQVLTPGRRTGPSRSRSTSSSTGSGS